LHYIATVELHYAVGVQREQWYDADPDAVWAAVVDPDLLAQWFGAPVTLEPEPGGRIRVGDDDRVGVVETWSPGRRLEWTWTGEGSDPASTVRIVLEPERGGTRVRVVEVALAAPAVYRPPVGFRPRRYGEPGALARL
jgi:uncharacterized protein YndB with AHSA1/START domain